MPSHSIFVLQLPAQMLSLKLNIKQHPTSFFANVQIRIPPMPEPNTSPWSWSCFFLSQCSNPNCQSQTQVHARASCAHLSSTQCPTYPYPPPNCLNCAFVGESAARSIALSLLRQPTCRKAKWLSLQRLTSLIGSSCHVLEA